MPWAWTAQTASGRGATSWPAQGHEVEHSYPLELKAHTHRGGDVGRMKEIPVRKTIMHAGVHHAGITVETLGQAIVGIERYDVLRAAAGSGRVGGTAGEGAGAVRVLLIAVIGADQIQLWNDRVPHAGPEYLQCLVVDVGRLCAALNIDEGNRVGGKAEARTQRSSRIRVLDMLVAAEDLQKAHVVQPN